MPKLFVALDLPPEAKAALGKLIPPDLLGVRRSPPEQMHLTLIYLGRVSPRRTSAILTQIDMPAFTLCVRGLGSFGTPDGHTVLWAGIEFNPELQQLHAALSASLAAVGFQPEDRPYTPHVTLARCAIETRAGDIAELLARQATFALPPIAMTEIHLYSSAWYAGAPVYRRERSFPLAKR